MRGAIADVLDRLGFAKDHVVQEFGYDSDVDDEFRFAVEDLVGSELEDEDYTGSTDAVLLWWRAEDGDLADAFADVLGTLAEDGFVVVLTPRPGRDGTVDATEIEEAATTNGQHCAGRFALGDGWIANRVVARRSGRA